MPSFAQESKTPTTEQPKPPAPGSDLKEGGAAATAPELGTNGARDNGNRIEIDSQFVDVSKIAGADRVRVQSDAARIDDPGEPGRLIDNDLHCSSARKRTTE